MVSAFQNLLMVLGGWHPSPMGLHFESIDGEEVTRLEDVMNIEVFFALLLLELHSDKELAANGLFYNFLAIQLT